MALFRIVLESGQKRQPALMERILWADSIGAKQGFVRLLRRTLAGEPDLLTVPNRQILIWLAYGIDVYLQDPGPKKLAEGLPQGYDPTVAQIDGYQKSITMAMPPAGYDAAIQDARRYADGVRVTRPFNAKAMRFVLAVLARNATIMVSEVDTFPQALEEFRATMKAADLPKETVNAFFDGEGIKEMNRQMQVAKTTVMLEFGLLEKNGSPVGDIAPLNGFRVAYRRGQADTAEGFLEQMKDVLKKAGGHDPVFSYIAATSDYQLRRLKGYRPTSDEVVKEFTSAWKQLDGYQPGTNVLLDTEAAEMMRSNHYWLDELARNPDVSIPAARAMLTRFAQWSNNLRGLPTKTFAMQPDEHLLNSTIAMGTMSALFVTWDGWMGLQEQFPSIIAEAKLAPNFIPEMALNCVTLLEKLVADLALSSEQSPFNLASEGLIPEFQGRAAFLQSAVPGVIPQRRRELLDQAAVLLRRSNSPDVEIPYLLRIADALLETGDSDGAIALWREAMQAAEELGYNSLAVEAATSAAKELARTQRWEEAASLASRSRELLEESLVIADNIEQDLGKVTELIVEANLRSKQPEKALMAISAGKQVQSASLQVNSSKALRSELMVVEQTKQDVAFLDAQVARVNSLPTSATRTDLLEESKKALADTRADYLVKSREIRQKNSELYSATLKFDPLNLVGVQKEMSPEILVVQYFATDSELYIFVVGRDTFRVRSQPTSAVDLDKATMKFLRSIRATRSNDAALLADSQALYQVLIKPISEDLVGRSTLIVIPSGRLNVLPFAALTDAEGKSLLDSVSLLELAKPGDLKEPAGAAASKARLETVVAFANATGDLPAADREGARIAELFPSSKVFRGKDASKENFLANSGQSDILHLATHGEWNVEDSLQNYLSFAGDQRVGQDDIFALSLDDTSLVILSACNTAMGDGGDIKFVASLAEAFWLAGSQSVVASLWSVDDESTALLMAEFYAALRAGAPKAEALRKAQLAVRANPAFTHPYYWSGFILFGQRQ